MRQTIYNPEMETLSRDGLAELQTQRLRRIVRYVWDRNPLYQRRFKDANIEPGDIRTLEDHAKLPTMGKDDLRLSFPEGFLCVDPRSVTELHTSSGSTGAPIAMLYTANDIRQWAECMARCYAMAGALPGDPIQVTAGFGLFNGGFGLYHGARRLGLFVIPTGAGNTARQVKMARDFKTRIFTGVVSYAVRILEELNKTGEKLPNLQLGVFGAEAFSPGMRKTIEEGLGIEAFDVYGMTETGGVGTLGQDCPVHDGIHVWEDHYFLEIIDEGGRPLPDGEVGELCVTSLTREALPVIRLRTGDLTRIVSRGPCACGRTHTRIASVQGRLDDMLIVKGVNFFPRQVEQALMEIPGVHPNYRITIEEFEGVKDVVIHVEAEPSVTGYTVEKHLKERLGFSPRGDVVAPGTLPRSEGKAQRVFHEKREAPFPVRPK